MKPLVDLVLYDEIEAIINAPLASLDELSDAIEKLDFIDQRMDIGKIQLRFIYGAMIVKRGREYGANVVGEIARRKRIPETTLREAARFARSLNCSPAQLREWIAYHTRDGARLHWTDVQRAIGANTNPNILGPQHMVKRLVGRAENLVRDMGAVNEMLADLPEDERVLLEEELRAAILTAGSEMAEFDSNIPRIESGHIRNSRPRNEDYLNWIRSHPCPITGAFPVEAHHVKLDRSGGTSLKGSDYAAVPLDPHLHREYHTIGHDSFESKYDVRFVELILNYIHAWVSGAWLTMDLPRSTQ